MHVHLLEGHLAGELQRHHDHPSDPEENDVEPGDQHIGGVEGFQLVGLFRPAQGGEGPQRGAEPGIQHVFVLAQGAVAQVVLAAHLVLVAAHIDVAVLVVPGGNPVAPPQLPGNAPVLQVAHPREVHVLVVLGHELDVAVFHRFDGRLGQGFHRHEPLVGEIGFDHHAGAVAARHLQGVVLDLLQQAQRVQIVDHFLAGVEPVQAAVGLRRVVVQMRLDGKQVDLRQIVALAHFVVVEVMGRGDFHAAGTEVRVHVIVGDNRNIAVGQWQTHGLADQILIARVFRVHRHGGVTEHGFRAGGGHHQVPGPVGKRIAEVPHVALFFAVFHFQVGDRGVQGRVPVHQAFTAVDQALAVQAHEHFAHRVGQAVVHGEAFPGPVHAAAHAAQLLGDGAAGFRLPLPDLVQEALAAQLVAVGAFRRQAALHHHLSGDAGVVGAHLPEGVAALHAAIAHQGVHDGVLEGVPHVQTAGHIRRRDHHREGFALPGGAEMACLFPGLVPGLLDAVGLVGFIHDLRCLHRKNEGRIIAKGGAAVALRGSETVALNLEAAVAVEAETGPARLAQRAVTGDHFRHPLKTGGEVRHLRRQVDQHIVVVAGVVAVPHHHRRLCHRRVRRQIVGQKAGGRLRPESGIHLAGVGVVPAVHINAPGLPPSLLRDAAGEGGLHAFAGLFSDVEQYFRQGVSLYAPPD